MKFKDEIGEEFELADVDWAKALKPGLLVIRPVVKAEPKYQIGEPKLFQAANTSVTNDSYVFSIGAEVSKDQAQLIKEAVEALMEYIEVNQTDSTYLPDSLIDAIKAAHRELRI